MTSPAYFPPPPRLASWLPSWSTHFKASTWVLNAMLVLHLIASLLVGCMVGLAAKGREMTSPTLDA